MLPNHLRQILSLRVVCTENLWSTQPTIQNTLLLLFPRCSKMCSLTQERVWDRVTICPIFPAQVLFFSLCSGKNFIVLFYRRLSMLICSHNISKYNKQRATSTAHQDSCWLKLLNQAISSRGKPEVFPKSVDNVTQGEIPSHSQLWWTCNPPWICHWICFCKFSIIVEQGGAERPSKNTETEVTT